MNRVLMVLAIVLSLVIGATSFGFAQVPTDWHPNWNFFANQIVFVSNRDNDSEIYIMDLSGNLLAKLTDNTTTDMEPARSPDGSQVAFYSARDGNFEIYVMNADGTGVRRLTRNRVIDWHPSWSPDGRRIVFESFRSRGPGLFVVDVESEEITQLTFDRRRKLHPSWSPDGQWIAYAAHSDATHSWEIFVTNVAGDVVKQLTNNVGIDWYPQWGPNGQWIAFESIRNGQSDIYRVSVETGEVRQVTNDRFRDTHPSWILVEGQFGVSLEIVYASLREAGWQIHFVEVTP
ncbi:MAG: DPP IV N-terminal domain-containing protein [Candidatus Bipolaricaulia bacterium]